MAGEMDAFPESTGETDPAEAKPKKRARSALRPGPKERAAAQQAAKEEETAAAAAAAKPSSSSKRAKPKAAATAAHEIFVANLSFEVTEERVRELFGGDAVLSIKWLEHKDSRKFKVPPLEPL